MVVTMCQSVLNKRIEEFITTSQALEGPLPLGSPKLLVLCVEVIQSVLNMGIEEIITISQALKRPLPVKGR